MVTKTGATGAFQEYSREPRVNALLFDFDIESARLKQLHRGYIEKILAPMIMHKGMLVSWKLKVIGHTSASGSQSYNKALSKRRA
jgi:outer membrane protein OmpA-like peptidoglycan-associated protein